MLTLPAAKAGLNATISDLRDLVLLEGRLLMI